MEFILTDRGSVNIDRAVKLGAKKFLCSPSLASLQLIQDPRLEGFEIFAMVPDFQQFVRDTSHYGTTGAAARRILAMPILKKIRLVKVALGHFDKALKFQFELLMNLFLMAEASKIPKPKAIFLHHQITDLALSFDQPGLFKIFHQIVSNEFGAQPGLSTLNFRRLAEALEENKLEFPWIMAPFNAKGYQMNPSPQACLEVLPRLRSKVIADNWNLQGTVPEKEALEYLQAHPFAAATI